MNRDDESAPDAPDTAPVDPADWYNQRIGQRIRAARSRRGMTRKDLSKHSSVSERYLAQAETGKANISIALLWRIAHALEVTVIDLLPDAETPSVHAPLMALLERLNPEQQQVAFELLKRHFSSALLPVHGVALIGLRGAGKTQLGDLLAERFEVPFVRLGEVVEHLAQMETAELFSLGGQKMYRRFERQALEHVIEAYPLVVLETGGSLVTEPATFARLLETYATVWIKASPEEHMNRVLAQGDLRPMGGNHQAMDDLKLMLAERDALYRQARFMLDTSGRSVSECLDELIGHARPSLLPKAPIT